MSFFLFFSFLSSFFKLRERERERVIAMLKKGVGRNSLNVYLSFDGFLRRVFSLLRANGILHIYIYGSGLKA